MNAPFGPDHVPGPGPGPGAYVRPAPVAALDIAIAASLTERHVRIKRDRLAVAIARVVAAGGDPSGFLPRWAHLNADLTYRRGVTAQATAAADALFRGAES